MLDSDTDSRLLRETVIAELDAVRRCDDPAERLARLRTLANSADQWGRICAMDLLAAIPEIEALALLAAGLNDRVSHVARASATALARRGDLASLEELTRAFAADEGELHHLADALSSFGEPALQRMLDFARHGTPDQKYSVLKHLPRFKGNAVALEAARALLEDAGRSRGGVLVSAAARRALRKLEAKG